MKKLFILTATLSLFAGCASVNQVTTKGPLYTYRADMQITFSTGTVYDGVGAMPLKGPIAMRFDSPVKLDRLQVTTCARQDVFQNAKWSFTYNYYPTPAEIGGLCPLYIEAYSKDQLTSWGFVAFRSDETLASHWYCNGQEHSYSGMAICQTKNGLEQRFDFAQDIEKFVGEPGCHLKQIDSKNFTITPDKGFCRATFKATGPDGKPTWGRAIVIGYDSVLVRE